jgi:hypothetical protein
MYPDVDTIKPTNDVHLGPNLSHNMPAGNPKEMPKFDMDPNNSTEIKLINCHINKHAMRHLSFLTSCFTIRHLRFLTSCFTIRHLSFLTSCTIRHLSFLTSCTIRHISLVHWCLGLDRFGCNTYCDKNIQ